MIKHISPSGVTRWAGILGAGVLSIVPLFAASATLSAVVSEERVAPIGPQTALVSWKTDTPTGGYVVYDTAPNLALSNAPLYGYSSMTPTVSILTATHEIAVGPLSYGATYYMRPVSVLDGMAIVGNEVSISASALAGSCAYVTEYLKRGADNDPAQVRNLQAFLRGVEKDASVSVTGVFDDATYEAVQRFQSKYTDDVLAPWGVAEPTGYVYITTKRKINEIFCSTTIALTKEEEAVIAASRAGGGIPPSQIGKGAVSSNGNLVWGDEEGSTTTPASDNDRAGIIGGIGNIKGKVGAFAAGTKSFLVKNQIFALLILVAAFAIVYLSRGKKEEIVETKLLKGK